VQDVIETKHTAMIEAQHELVLTYAELGQLCGVSKRTVQRWFSNNAGPMTWHFHAVARAVYPRNPQLAAKLAKHGATTLEALGLARPPAPPAVDWAAQADALVYAAAEALDVSPRTVRGAVSMVLAGALKAGGDVNPLARHFAAGARGGKP
jgi:hypothetical protein